MSQPDGRRRRAALSCNLCRRRKIRCNRENPCSNCLRARSETCEYGSSKQQPVPTSRQNTARNRGNVRSIVAKDAEHVGTDAMTAADHSTAPCSSKAPSSVSLDPSSVTTPRSQQSGADTELARMKLQIRQLQEQLHISSIKAVPSPRSGANANIESENSRLGGTFHINFGGDLQGQSGLVVNNLIHKNRLLGRSHWAVNGILLVRDIITIIEPHMREQSCRATESIERCKSLARLIKAKRSPSWPCAPAPDIPAKPIADILVSNYLRVSETIYRVLHIPTFCEEYEAVWALNATPSTAFMVRLKLVLAIGAINYDDKFSLRADAIRWVYEAQSWAAEPRFKSRLDISSLQTNLLLLLAQEGVGVRGDNMWISIGALLRKTIFMGLHQDPSHLPGMTTFEKEMRRRLWNTVIELSLQASLATGGPPLLSQDDFNTEPPRNLDDEQLLAKEPMPKPDDEFTQVSAAIALRSTFLERLAVVKFLNNINPSNTYEESLRLDKNLRLAFRRLRETLEPYNSSHSRQDSFQFTVHTLDILLYRYLVSLHVPYYSLSLHDTAHAYSRKVVVESSLKIWRSVYPDLPFQENAADNATSVHRDLDRLVTCRWGFYPTAMMQAALCIALELRAEVQEDESLSPANLRPDLLSVLDEVQTWCTRVIEAGETNMKGYILLSLLIAQIQGLRQRLKKDLIASLLYKTVDDAAERCLMVLEEHARDYIEEGGDDTGLEHVLPTPSMTTEEDWGFLISDGIFDTHAIESMNWLFDE
ncbi:hypothetical protein QQS21_001390 [Conoideocrella luteorostrata]|uniref:Zn(2)-C6 fungal-type domain-containing protein n=1 Tax=Conoideocrella luteorostrata TaxID=1105319 RepID=A0AAJ0CY16_9HYPO|nr:hypothetical protein QQS21_001390 [Conoideocrella luteorostrata]